MTQAPSPGEPGASRDCPHCRAVILESAGACPACGHFLRFDGDGRRQPDQVPLHVEGLIRHPDEAGAWEYSVVVAVRDGSGREIARHVVGVGALRAGEERNVALTVEVFETGADSTRRH